MGQEPFVELLAPAGNKEAFYGAIHAGADAVYLGGSRFGARAYADNFTTQELTECIRYAHLWGKKVYLTVNTLVKECEFGEIYEYIKPVYEAGLDGVIVQDIGVFVFIREYFPEMELHVSTQMALTGVHGAALLKEMGACRIVPARELSLQEIIHIKRETGLAIETFIHGAMCYCYSGQCLFSSLLGGRSGNRGRCAQPCRLPYKVETEKGRTKECFPLSLKDMCTIEHIPELIQAGIDSFKIEGRMKKPEYAAGVTAIYRKYIDRYYAKEKWKLDPEDLADLANLYIRSERQDGYYKRHNGRDMVTLHNPAYSGSDEQLLSEIRRQYIDQKPKMPILLQGTFLTGREAAVTAVLGDLTVSAKGDMVEKAGKQPITEENIKKQLGKLGDSIFEAGSMEIAVSEDAFYSLGAVNGLRREAVKKLEEALLVKNGFPVERTAAPFTTEEVRRQKEETPCRGIHVSVRTLEQLQAVKEYGIRQTAKNLIRISVDSDLLLLKPKEVQKLSLDLAPGRELVAALPYIIRQSDDAFVERFFSLLPETFTGILVRNLEGMGMLKDRNYRGHIYGDAGFYIWNKETLKEWKPFLSGFCMPFELKSGEQRALIDGQDYDDIICEKVVYGRIPMMVTANCLVNTTDQCRKESGRKVVYLIDRYQKRFPVEVNCTHCMNIIYNSVPLSLHSEILKWKERALLRLDFTVETGRETAEILDFYLETFSGSSKREGKELRLPFPEYTTGHEKRGVE